MPILFTGMSMEPGAIPYEQLFEGAGYLQNEINRRAWRYLREIGYHPYKEQAITVSIIKRNEMAIVHITASFEEQFREQLVDLEIPMKQFAALVPEEREG